VLNEIRSKISFFTCDFNDVSVGALAADNLSCSGPFGKLPPGKTPISNGSIDVGPHKAGTICVDVGSGKEIVELKCSIADKSKGTPFDYYYCEINTSCGIGAFSNATRKASGKSGVDSVCINYTNSTAGNQSARLKVEIH
jgi:hypothetical protein